MAGVLAVAEPNAAAEEPPAHPAKVRPVDGAVIGTAIAASVILRTALQPERPEWTAPLPPPRLGPLDAQFTGRFSMGASVASDHLLRASIVAPAVIHLFESSWSTRHSGTARPGRYLVRRYATDMILYTEALAVSGLATSLLKRLVHRPRPLSHLHAEQVRPSQREDLADAQHSPTIEHSFPSGHTSWAFTAATAGATLLTMKMADRPRSPRKTGLLGATWVMSLGAAGSVAALRVAAGRHYPTDVLAGAALGTLFGVGIPLLHRPRQRKQKAVAWSLTPSVGRDLRGVSLGAAF